MITVSPNNRRLSFLVVLQYVLLVGVVLYFGQTLFIPLSFALLISFILYPFCRWLENRGISRVLAIVMGILLLIIFFGTLIGLLIQQLVDFGGQWDGIRMRLHDFAGDISRFLLVKFSIGVDQQKEWVMGYLKDSSLKVIPFLQQVIGSSGIALVLFCLVPVYVALILYHRHRLSGVLVAFFDEENRPAVREVLVRVSDIYYRFIRGMLLVYLIVGILNSLGLLLLGVPNPFLFGFLASIMTFIPYVGIIVASLLPITISWVTFNSVWYPVGIIAVFSVVQYLEATIIFPFAVSRQLQVNSLATIVVIMAGGILWGVAGMVLFVPFLAILKLIADHVEGMDNISLLIGKK